MPKPLKLKSAKAGKGASAAPKVKKARADPPPPAALADEDEIKLPELAEGELDEVEVDQQDNQARAEGDDAGEEGEDVPDPFASDDEGEEVEESRVGRRQRESEQAAKAAALQRLKSSQKAKTKTKDDKEEKPARAVLYVGHIPYGFFEQQMRSYFSQFGTVLNIRLSRNRKTGKSKHFAFVEFDDLEVARIVAETMNGYFLFGKTLVVRLVPPEKLHPDTFVGANRKFRVVPWRRVAQRQHNGKRTAAQAEKRQARLLSKEEGKRKRLAALGIDYDFAGYQAQQVPKATRTVFE